MLVSILITILLVALVAALYYLRKITYYLDLIWWYQCHTMDGADMKHLIDYQMGCYKQKKLYNHETGKYENSYK